MGIYNGLIDTKNRKEYHFGKLPCVKDVFYAVKEKCISIEEISEYIQLELKWEDRMKVKLLGKYIQDIFKNNSNVWYLHDGEFISNSEVDNLLIDNISDIGISLYEFYDEFEKIDVRI